MKPDPQTKIILDTDPGGDDAFAFLWLASLIQQDLAKLVAVTATDGNVQASLTFTNACKLLQLTGLDQVEVGRGVLNPDQAMANAAMIHGHDGLGNLAHTLPVPHQNYQTARFSDEILIETLTNYPGDITIVALGPLNNLAAAEIKSPGILQAAKEIVLMGGAFRVPGNVTPEAEFNIAYNPEAAALVFNQCQNLVILPLDVTRSLIFTPEMANDISQNAPDQPITQFIQSLCQSMSKASLAHRETQGIQGFLVHDAVTLAYLFYPETLQFYRARTDVETVGQFTRGRTLADFRHQTKLPANAWVAATVDPVNLLACLIEDLKCLGTFS
ncbi:MAG: nucleoside hydrolase [Oscillatoriales cyanobacterium RM2_1_1]|nr:nucleoside hydrolase [Oscillatoriales cyanobacterium SM2_3_0]NJO44890.1 nucleoside hydrolase [Oscillatoriales cyanobacterium RM2_1_1]